MIKPVFTTDKTFLVIADTQAPYHHKDYIDFCKKQYDKHKCTEVFHIGDMTDQYNQSSHGLRSDADSPIDERRDATTFIERLYKLFPHLRWVWGNHEERFMRFLMAPKSNGSALAWSQEEIMDQFRIYNGVPDSWTIEDKYIVKSADSTRANIIVQHGHQQGSTNILGSVFSNETYSVINGHHHTTAGIRYTANEERLRFHAIVGCGMDRKLFAFAYAQNNIKKPVLSCLVVKKGVPMLVPMELK